jgi:hypothetical protein
MAEVCQNKPKNWVSEPQFQHPMHLITVECRDAAPNTDADRGNLDLRQIETNLLGEVGQAMLLDRLDCLGRNTQTHKAITFGPPETLPLEIDFLEFVGANVGVGDGHCVIRLLPGQLTSTRHGGVSKLKKRCILLMQLSSIPGSVVIRKALFSDRESRHHDKSQ